MTDLLMLAAGLGKRFANLNGDVPKVLLRLPSGRTLLAENLTSAVSTGIMAGAVVVTGYRADLVDHEVTRHESVSSIVTVHNPNYATHGPIHSLWAARETLEHRDVIIMNGDTFYRPDVFRAVSRRRQSGFHLAYSRRGVEHDDVKVRLEADWVSAVGKRIPPADAQGVSAGLFLVRGKDARARFLSALSTFIRDAEAGGQPVIWHDLVGHLASIPHPVFAVEVEHGDWREVDTPDDYAALRAALA